MSYGKKDILPVLLNFTNGRYLPKSAKSVLRIVKIRAFGIGFATSYATSAAPTLLAPETDIILQCGLGLYVFGRSINDSSINLSWSCSGNA